MQLKNLSNIDIGKYGEDLASEYLLKKGYSILERNFRYKKSEIDIICLHNKLLIFVEVKLRTSLLFGYPEEFVNKTKIRAIKKAALCYILKKDWQKDVRYDIISIEAINNHISITHFEDAFY